MKKLLSRIKTAAALSVDPPAGEATVGDWLGWAGHSTLGMLAWFTTTLKGLLCLLPLLLFIPTAYISADLSYFVPAAYGLVFAGLGLRSAWKVAKEGSTRSKLMLGGMLVLMAVVSAVALGILVVLAVGALQLALTLLVLYVLYRIARLFLGSSKPTRTSRGPKVASVGEVWLIEVPNHNPDEPEPFKVRPSVVLEANPHQVTFVFATSQEKRENQRGYFEVTTMPGWPGSPDKRSFLNVGSPVTLPTTSLVAQKSFLPPESFKAVVSRVS